MKSYLDIVDNVLLTGKLKENRTGVKTLSLANQHFSHDMSDGFPLLTTKKMPIKTIAVELEGFIKGITSKTWYQDRGCRIWNEWANPCVVQNKIGDMAESGGDTDIFNYVDLKKRIQLQEDDLGPIYGYQWRRFGEAYDEDDNGMLKGFDQFAYIVKALHDNPSDRRMVCSAWHPNQFSRMALPPCHLAWVVTVIDDTLHLHWTQRSCDLALGVAFNIASYALLMTLLCAEANLKPGNLSGLLCDCHIYENHIKPMVMQLERKPYALPTLRVNNDTFLEQEKRNHRSNRQFNIFNWTHKDIKLTGYESHPKISLSVAI